MIPQDSNLRTVAAPGLSAPCWLVFPAIRRER
jgi:hypothetical protein